MQNEQLSGGLSEAEILRLHREQDPASPLFKGSQSADAGIPGATAEGTEPASAYYEPTADKLDPIADEIPEPQGTTTTTTEEASGITPEPEEQLHEISQEDLDENPDLAEHVQVGDEVILGEPVDASAAEETKSTKAKKK